MFLRDVNVYLNNPWSDGRKYSATNPGKSVNALPYFAGIFLK